MSNQEEDEWKEVPTKGRRRPSGETEQTAGSSGAAASSGYGPRAAGARPAPAPLGDANKVVVGGLTPTTTAKHLLQAFAHFGQIADAEVHKDTHGNSRQSGCVTFFSTSSANRAASSCTRVDGKLITSKLGGQAIRRANGPSETQDAAKEVRNFVTRLELTGPAREALLRHDPKIVSRVVQALEMKGGKLTSGNPGLILGELDKVLRSNLDQDLEQQISGWVQAVGLPPAQARDVENTLLSKSPEEIEYILGQPSSFVRRTAQAKAPASFILGCLKAFRHEQMEREIEVFCARFSFSARINRQLQELFPERARRLIQRWKPGQSQKGNEADFQNHLSQATRDQVAIQEERMRQRDESAVDSHARIIQGWADDDDDEDEEVEEVGERTRSSPGCEEIFSASTDWTLGTREADGQAGPRVFQMSAEQGTSAQVSSVGQASFTKVRKMQLIPTHFVFAVDSSGSMLTEDCKSLSGYGMIRRLDAVRETLISMIHESELNKSDIFSLITFNEESCVQFSCISSIDAMSQLRTLQFNAERQTLYGRGVRGIEYAMSKDTTGRPAHVIFLSDGEPTDEEAYLKRLHSLVRKFPGDKLKLWTIGFGENVRVTSAGVDFVFLQQMASIGGGHFQKAGPSLESLQGAMQAITSSITVSRSSTRRSERESITGPQRSSSSSSQPSGPPAAAGAAAPEFEAIVEGEDEEETFSESGREESEGGSEIVESLEFEMPNPRSIFHNVRDSLTWQHFAAATTEFAFDGKQFTEKLGRAGVYVRRKPFIRGGMRVVYGMVLDREADSVEAAGGDRSWRCAKRLIKELNSPGTVKSQEAFCKSTAVAAHYAKMFRQLLGQYNGYKKHTFGFLDCTIYSPLAGESGFSFCGEKWLKGHFVKLNSNNGWVNEAEYKTHSDMAQAFSHFTFDRSKGELMVVDLQGTCNAAMDGTPYCLLTDPQVHSTGGFGSFGAGDLGIKGVNTFFKNHRCNHLCQKLRLRSQNELQLPTRTLPVPAVRDCIARLWGPANEAKELFDWLRRKYSVSTISIPRDAEGEWREIRIWAPPKGGAEALKVWEARLEAYYKEARTIVPVQPKPAWLAEKWLSMLAQWRIFGVGVVGYPAFWYENGKLPEEVWLFGSRHEYGKVTAAMKQIKEDLEKAQSGAASSSAGGAQEQTFQGGTIRDDGSMVLGPSWVLKKDEEHNAWYWTTLCGSTWHWQLDAEWEPMVNSQNKKSWLKNERAGLWHYTPYLHRE